MAQFTQFGRPVSVTYTIVGGGTVELTDITDATFSLDPEAHEHYGGAARFPRFAVGDDNTTIKFTTTDVRAFALLQGMELTAVKVIFEATATAMGADGDVDKAAGTIVLEVAKTAGAMRVVEPVVMKNGSDGKAGEIEVTLRAAVLESTGVEADIVIDVTI